MNIKHICFDLDGTLVDSRDTIIKSTIASLDALKISHDISCEKFTNMIGLHFRDIFNELGISGTDFDSFLKIYKSKYFNFIDESVLYENVEEVLNSLLNSKVKVSLLTTKAQDQADKIIDHFNLRKYFSVVMGRRERLQHKPSPESLLYICDELNIDPEVTLMVGDTELDILCGKNAGSKTCGVLYGYRTKEQLTSNKPDFLIHQLGEIKKIVK